ncbi:MAG: hypothetical protein ACLVEJ_18240 [Parabacteroides sp.]
MPWISWKTCLPSEVPAALTVQGSFGRWSDRRPKKRSFVVAIRLKNCCYDFFELATLEYWHRGLLGEVIHAEGAYIPTQRLEVIRLLYRQHWRLEPR